jgi:hypothetical protein
VRFEDITDTAGLTFVHYNGATEEKYVVECMGSGGGFFDYDSDGDLDIYLLNGAPLPGSVASDPPPANKLYRNDGDGKFIDVTAASGVGDTGYGMGLTAADIDNDGDVDLYVTNFGPNVFYRNNGDGTFTDITEQTGTVSPDWSASAAFGDYDADGFLDLFVTNYVDFSLDNHKFCGNLAKNIKAYCHPDVYNAVPSLLFKNNGDVTFSDVTREAGIWQTEDGKGLGVVWGDYDNDGDADIYVANDSMTNFLYQNDGDGKFTDMTLLAGVGYSEDGQAMAGMGTDMADYDADGWLDVVVTNLDFEYNSIYRGDSSGVFTDVSYNSGLAEPSINYVGFGTFFFDFDNDSWQDIFVANGHIVDNIELFNSVSTYAQPNFVLKNKGDGSLVESSSELGDAVIAETVARGAAPGDIDGDGDEDVLVTQCGRTAQLLRNDGGNGNSWIALRLVGRRSNRDAVGARVTVRLGEKTFMKEVKTGVSYLSQRSFVLLFGLGGADAAEGVAVRWPSGEVQELGSISGRTKLTVVEGVGPVASAVADP